jgi:hypothetical protein
MIVNPPQTSQEGGTIRTRSGHEDDYEEKLVKFVPAEVLSGFLVLTTAAGDYRALIIGAFVAGLIATPAYLFLASRGQPSQTKRPHSYVLAIVAFAAWAIGTNADVANLFTIDQRVGYWILAATVFLIPAIDGVLVEKVSW